MSLCVMPLVIKVKMTEENYKKLMEEASERFTKTYLKKTYKYKKGYFSIITENYDDFSIFEEAKLAAKYAESTKSKAGLIFVGGTKYSVGDLYFKDGAPYILNNYGSKNWEESRANYLELKENFLNSFK